MIKQRVSTSPNGDLPLLCPATGYGCNDIDPQGCAEGGCWKQAWPTGRATENETPPVRNDSAEDTDGL